MTSAKPHVSVGMPVYNGENYVEQALDSILTQTYLDFELIISDNASTDGTQRICQAYAAQHRRIRYYRNQQNVGAARNYNRVFELSTGEYFKWAAHDDVLAPDFLSKCVQVLDETPEVVLSYPRAKIIDEEGTVVSTYDVVLRTDSPKPAVRFHDLIWVRHWCLQVFGLIRSSVLRMTPLHGDYASSDRVLLLRLALLGRFHEIPEYLFLSRSHAQQAGRMVYDLHAYAAWFDPAKEGRLLFPASKLVLEHAIAVRDSPLSPSEQAYCYLTGLLRLAKFSRILVKDALMPARLMLRRLGASTRGGR